MRDFDDVIRKVKKEFEGSGHERGFDIEIGIVERMLLPYELEFRRWEAAELVIEKYAPIHAKKYQRNIVEIWLGEGVK